MHAKFRCSQNTDYHHELLVPLSFLFLIVLSLQGDLYYEAVRDWCRTMRFLSRMSRWSSKLGRLLGRSSSRQGSGTAASSSLSKVDKLTAENQALKAAAQASALATTAAAAKAAEQSKLATKYGTSLDPFEVSNRLEGKKEKSTCGHVLTDEEKRMLCVLEVSLLAAECSVNDFVIFHAAHPQVLAGVNYGVANATHPEAANAETPVLASVKRCLVEVCHKHTYVIYSMLSEKLQSFSSYLLDFLVLANSLSLFFFILP